MFKQNEKCIAQIAEYIPRACRGMQLQEAKARLEKKLRSISMTAVMLPFLMRPLRQLLTAIRGSLFFVHRSAAALGGQMSNSLQILCIKDTEGYWTVNERYPARQFCRAFAHLMKMHENHYTRREDVAKIRARYWIDYG